jgi:transcriptional regulator with XRE-family HTH domain
MARAGKALKQTLQDYGISQNRLAVTMGIARSTVHYWFNETQDPQADTIPAIVAALEAIEPAAVRTFLEAYLGRSLTDWITPDPP